jgi:hypothetical protein
MIITPAPVGFKAAQKEAAAAGGRSPLSSRFSS